MMYLMSVFLLVDVDKWLQVTKDNLTSQDKQNLRISEYLMCTTISNIRII